MLPGSSWGLSPWDPLAFCLPPSFCRCCPVSFLFLLLSLFPSFNFCCALRILSWAVSLESVPILSFLPSLRPPNVALPGSPPLSPSRTLSASPPPCLLGFSPFFSPPPARHLLGPLSSPPPSLYTWLWPQEWGPWRRRGGGLPSLPPASPGVQLGQGRSWAAVQGGGEDAVRGAEGFEGHAVPRAGPSLSGPRTPPAGRATALMLRSH